MPGGIIIAIELRAADTDQDSLSTLAAQTGRALAAVPGVTSTRWYRKLNDLRSLVIAESTSPEVADYVLRHHGESSAVAAITVARELSDMSLVDPAETFGWPLLYTVSFAPPVERVDELARWYDEEHVPMLQEAPDWARTRRCEVLSTHGIEASHLAMHYLRSVEPLRSEARDNARQTPWRDRLAAEAWFRSGRYVIWVQERGSGSRD